jgi:hypothetical protein
LNQEEVQSIETVIDSLMNQENMSLGSIVRPGDSAKLSLSVHVEKGRFWYLVNIAFEYLHKQQVDGLRFSTSGIFFNQKSYQEEIRFFLRVDQIDCFLTSQIEK